MKKIYKNFEDYATNDPKYLLRVLKGELHRPQAKITFADGSCYSVTRAGSRWWEYYGKLHREDGPSGIFPDGRMCYYLFTKPYETREEWEAAVEELQKERTRNNK
jgi:hypothetical protein